MLLPLKKRTNQRNEKKTYNSTWNTLKFNAYRTNKRKTKIDFLLAQVES